MEPKVTVSNWLICQTNGPNPKNIQFKTQRNAANPQILEAGTKNVWYFCLMNTLNIEKILKNDKFSVD